MRKVFKKVFTLLAVFSALGIIDKAQIGDKERETPRATVKKAVNPLVESVTYHGFKPFGDDTDEIYGGDLSDLNKIIDGDDSTRCYFSSAPAADAYIQLNLREVTRIRDVRMLFHEEDKMAGVLSYSEDGVTFKDDLLDNTINYKYKVFDYRAKPFMAKYLRLTSNKADAAAWVQMYDFSINNFGDRPLVADEGFTFVSSAYWNNVDNMTDGDMNTYTWYDWHNSAQAHITLQYPDEQEVRSIHMFASNPDKQGDYFKNMTFYYSTDGVDFIQVGEESYIDQKEVVVNLETPVRASYIRVMANEVENTGFMIREFGINHEKVEAEITFENATPYTYTGTGLTPTYTVPYLTEVKIHYTWHEVFYSNDAPSRPGWYAMVVTVKESLYYKETSKFTVFCIQDTKEHFISEWNKAMETGVCDYALGTGDSAEYAYLLEVYNECLPDENDNNVKAEVANYKWSETSTIGETMEYIAQLKALNTKQATSTEINSLLVKDNSTTTLGLVFIILTGLMIIGSYWLYYKKKYN